MDVNKVENGLRVSRWIIRELSETINDNDKYSLELWLSQSEENRQLYEEIKLELVSRISTRAKEYDVEEGWQQFLRKSNKGVTVKKVSLWRTWSRYAAVLLLLLSVGGGMFYLVNEKNKSLSSYAAADIVPGSNRAYLILTDGSRVPLSESGSLQQVVDQSGAVIRNDSGIISYASAREQTTTDAYNTLQIPRGGEYCLVLNDGTKIWMNSNTTLKYPVHFSGDKRQVELEGEAYFQVAHDSKRQFIVKTGAAEIKVYGTSFNVCAYADDPSQHTTLESGSIGLTRGSKEYRLEPGQQAVLDTKTGGVEVKQVNTKAYCSWYSGNFIFEEERLENILIKLSRWYDVEVFYRNERLKGYHFTGDLGRYEDFKEVLSMLEMTMKVRFEVKGRTIIVNAK